MTLPKENLDTKTYEDLVKEAVSRIPIYASEWTDHNVHDPGRTFIELFAWLAEMQIYSLNRITDMSRSKFLKLMGITELRPAKAATVDVTFSLLTGTPTPIDEGTIVASCHPVSGEDILFETQQDLMVLDAELTKIFVHTKLFCWDNIPGNDNERLIRFLKTKFGIEWAETATIEKIDDFMTIRVFAENNFLCLRLTDEKTKVKLEIDDVRTDEFTVETENGKLNVYQNYIDGSDANKNENVYYYAFRSKPEVGDELYLGFDKDPGKDITLAFYLFIDCLAERGIESQLFSSGKVRWEYWNGSDWQSVEYLFNWDNIPGNDNERLIRFLKTRFGIEWAENAKFEKTDNSMTIRVFTEKQSLSLRLNNDKTKVNLEIDDGRTDEFTVETEDDKLNIYVELIDKTNHLSISGKIRINITGQMAKKNVEDNDLYWLKCVVEDGTYDIPPKINQICLNTVCAIQRTKLKEDRFSGSGLPGFYADIKDVPVLDAMKEEGEGTPRITVGTDKWSKVEDFDASKPGDKHYTMDLKTGRVSFGDGIHGNIPPEGENNILICYRTGGGVRGNVKAGTMNKVEGDPGTKVSVTNHQPAMCGEDAETLEEAIQRARMDLKTPYRAVTSQDYERLAKNTPGVRVARAKALPGYYPGKDSTVPGIVSVIAVPKVRDDNVNPKPSPGFLKTVYEHLDKHRLLTTELYVLRPDYEEITVKATVRIHPRFVVGSIEEDVIKKLNDFLHLTKGGAESAGWPFGRSVYRSEIYEVLDRVEGVDHIEGVSLAKNGTGFSDDINITIPPHSLVYSGNHQIEVKEVKE